MVRSNRRTVLVAVVASLITSVVVGGGTLALANHQWTDVPTANAFHEDVDAFTQAGCGEGYPDGTFRPTQPVLRQQAARFLRACGVRMAREDDEAPTSLPQDGSTVHLGIEPMNAGALGEGSGFVLAVATVEVSTTDTTAGDFPCAVSLVLASPTVGLGGLLETSVVSFRGPSTEPQQQNATLTQVWPIEANRQVLGRISAFRTGSCSASLGAEADLTLLYVPFPDDA